MCTSKIQDGNLKIITNKWMTGKRICNNFCCNFSENKNSLFLRFLNGN